MTDITPTNSPTNSPTNNSDSPDTDLVDMDQVREYATAQGLGAQIGVITIAIFEDPAENHAEDSAEDHPGFDTVSHITGTLNLDQLMLSLLSHIEDQVMTTVTTLVEAHPLIDGDGIDQSDNVLKAVATGFGAHAAELCQYVYGILGTLRTQEES